MSRSSAVFISRLRGLPVLDAAGDQVGKVRDVVIQLRTQGRAPRVRGLVVELFARRKIFVPMPRVHAIDVNQVMIAGTVDTRVFSRREAETLVVDDLFDRTFTRDGSPVSIFDVAMRSVRTHDWEISQVAVTPAGGHNRFTSLRKKALSTIIVDWDEVPALLMMGRQSTERTVAEMQDMKPADVARELHDMSPRRRAEVAKALDDDQLADAIEELPEDEQVSLILILDPERAADILEEMDPDDAADLVQDLPDNLAERLLARMRPEDAEDVRNLLVYDDFTAGAMMTPEPVILGPDATVADALAKVRSEDITPALASMVFVCRPPLDTPSGRYLGVVHVQRLLREPPSTMVSLLLDTDLQPLATDTPVGAISRYFATYNLVVAPVVNSGRELVGAVTVDDLLDHLLPADWRGDQMDGQLAGVRRG
ncbi:CBS domain-containing protein [Acidipropionibacterium jensenii]|uniref:CBS domain-containing protein n=1 Tax=Acidipropionibacterium jensenii TaxID=1749 RepID=A0A3Q9UL12_9ACTN|nr:CBS domain-containing protein [Acidipropionibacterium jensenii]AZZ39865.1 CBS domain-containing protein [Acidipropionibacterium jensenii]